MPSPIKVFRGALEAGRWAPGSVAAIGKFDAMHLGHRRLIAEAAERARAIGRRCLAVTFDPLPQELLIPGFKPLLPLSERLRLLGESGADGALLLPFDAALACLAAEAFARDVLAGALKISEVVVGANFCFGRGREGRFDTLETLGRQLGFTARALPLLEIGGRTVSTSSIRSLVQEGRLEEAARLLGRPLSERRPA